MFILHLYDVICLISAWCKSWWDECYVMGLLSLKRPLTHSVKEVLCSGLAVANVYWQDDSQS